jgi:hypothetical protein
MRRHFGDFLDRDGGYWTTIPNRDRYAYRIHEATMSHDRLNEHLRVGRRSVSFVDAEQEDDRCNQQSRDYGHEQGKQELLSPIAARSRFRPSWSSGRVTR